MKRRMLIGTLLFLCLVISGQTVSAQTSEFSYQGNLNNGGSPANGSYDFEFALFDALAGGSQVGSTVTRNSVAVTSGVFSVKLDFGNQFPGAGRYLEIRVRQTGGGGFTVLSPRQLINSSPYSLKSLTADNAATATNASQLGGVAAGQYVLTGDARLSDARNPLPGSANYIQNSTSPQSSSNFNVSGTGTANIFSATTQYNLGTNRILTSVGTNNLFVGFGAGELNTTGIDNAFFGRRAGFSNTTGFSNAFFGSASGANSAGNFNSFFGAGSGAATTTGDANSFFGNTAGNLNTTGLGNTFIGNQSGETNTTGTFNTALGYTANVGSANLSFATAIGSGSVVSTSNTITLGRSGGQDTVNIPGPATITGALTANGSGLTNLNAGNFTSGTLPIGRGGTGLTAVGASGNYLRSNGSVWVSSAIQAADIPVGSGNYIQNGTVQQPTSNFSISGTGTAFIFDAAFEYRISGFRILSRAGTNNLFAGVGSGQANTLGLGNSFFGSNAGSSNTTGSWNSFFGNGAGEASLGGQYNAYFGASAGQANASGVSNSFFGSSTGVNSVGSFNAFFGYMSGNSSTTGNYNSFFGSESGTSNTTGEDNVFIGRYAGTVNTTGSRNTLIGRGAGVAAINLTNATAIGAFSQVAQSNSLVLGSINGVNAATADTNVGIGTTAPNHRLTIGPTETPIVTTATVGIYGAGAAYSIIRDTTNNIEAIFGADTNGGLYGTVSNNPVVFRTNNTGRMTIAATGEVSITTLGAAGATTLCRNASNQISTCSSSLRYKTNIGKFSQGMSFVNRLRPISFEWKDGGLKDVGFGAEDIAKIDPRFVTFNDKGEVEGVKYDRLSVAFVNAFKEQQAEISEQAKKIEAQNETIQTQQQRIDKQEELLKQQQAQLDALKKFICSLNPAAVVCKEEKQ